MSEGRERMPIGLEPTEVSERELPLDGRDATLPGMGVPPDHTAPSAPGSPGELRAGEHVGRYLIERKVGAGGMGEVYAAHDPQLDRRVAIKVLRPTGRATDAAARLVREAQALAKLAHPNVVAVHDVGEADDRVFLAMQFVEGTTLGEHLARTALAPDQIVGLYVAAGRGLAAAHAAGLVHRDMKPSNVLIDRAGHVAVTDFGVARASDDFATPEPRAPSWDGSASTSGVHSTGRSALSTDMTQAGAVIGTPSYMAPEQHAGRRATAKSDQFGFCVSLWQGLFGKHPFVPHDHDDETSAFEYMALISEGVLIAPRHHRTPSGHAISRRVIAALTRGLAKDPDARWPSMGLLLAELEPRSSSRAVVIGLAAVATAGAAAALWFALAERGAHGPSCSATTGERVETAWTAARAGAIHDSFARSGRPYADGAATGAAGALDRYAQRWRALAVDACAGADHAAAAGPQYAQARTQCLDRTLGALRSVATLLAESPRAELVDNALAVVGGVPELDDCDDPATLIAAGAPAPERAAAVAALEDRLATANAKFVAGLLRDAIAELEAMVPEVDAAGWAPLRVRTRNLLGEIKQAMLAPAMSGLIEAAQIATEHGLTRDAARAWLLLVAAAGAARQPDAVDAYTAIAQATAAASHEPALVNSVRIVHGRALTRLRRVAPAEAECRAALTDVRARPDAQWREQLAARDCLLEALVPLGKWAEARALAEEAMADTAARLSPEHPAIADYLGVIATVKRRQGQTAEAKADLERAYQLRLRAFGSQHWKIAESLSSLADLEPDLGKRKVLLEEALVVARAPEAQTARTPYVEYSIESGLAVIAGEHGDQDAMQRHFDRALVLAAQLAGPRSLDVGLLLIGYGQFMSRVDLDQAIVKLRQAAEILDEGHDPRAEIARSALAMMLMNDERYAEALPLLEHAIAGVDVKDVEPVNLAMMRFSLARALAESHGDRVRARALAIQALAGYRALGPELADNAKDVERWLKRHAAPRAR